MDPVVKPEDDPGRGWFPVACFLSCRHYHSGPGFETIALSCHPGRSKAAIRYAARLIFLFKVHGYWIPAFAGTTKGVSRGLLGVPRNFGKEPLER